MQSLFEFIFAVSFVGLFLPFSGLIFLLGCLFLYGIHDGETNTIKFISMGGSMLMFLMWVLLIYATSEVVETEPIPLYIMSAITGILFYAKHKTG